jgi:hypothetical protein
MGAVERFCDRAMLIERGRIQAIGEPHAIARAYNELNFGRLVHAEVESARYGDHVACEIEDAWFESDGERVPAIGQGAPLTIVTRVRFHEALSEPVFAAALRNEVGHTVFSTSTAWSGVRTGSFAPNQVAEVRIHLETWFAASHYKLSPSVAREGDERNALDLREDLVSLVIHSTRVTGGVVDVPHSYEITRA